MSSITLPITYADSADNSSLDSGSLANRPAASPYLLNKSYYETDTNKLDAVLDGVSWTQIAASPELDALALKRNSDTLANILLDTAGWDVGDIAYATDYGYGPGFECFFDGTAWKFPPKRQLLKYIHTDTTLAANTSENTAFSVTLPALGANDIIEIESMWTLTNNANAKTINIKLDGTNGFTRDYASFAGVHTYNTIVNRNDAAVQCWTNNNVAIWGGTANALQTSTKATGVAGKVLSLTGTKATAGDTMTLNWCNIWLTGGG